DGIRDKLVTGVQTCALPISCNSAMAAMTYYDRVNEAAAAIRARVPEAPAIGIVLGSGLGDFANSLGDPVVMPYGELPHWPASRVIGHEGKLVVGTVARSLSTRSAGPSNVAGRKI